MAKGKIAAAKEVVVESAEVKKAALSPCKSVCKPTCKNGGSLLESKA